MNTEIELCLCVLPKQQGALIKQISVLFPAASRPEEQELYGIYYDTPALDLARHRMGLRLRKQDGYWVQAVKLGRPGEGALHTRLEFEHATKKQALELHRISHPSTRDFLTSPKIAPLLQPVFATRILRTLWQIPYKKDGLVELALDIGVVECQGNSLVVSEIECELKSGPIEAVFAVAQTLAEHFALFPQLRSKAERGYRLFTRTAATPEEARIPELHASMSPWRARQTVMLECLRHLEYNLMEIGHGDDVEFVHQARVAIRRMRSADRTFPRLSADAQWCRIMKDLQTLGRMLGQIRDCDVLLHDSLTVAKQSFPSEERAWSAIRSKLLSQRRQYIKALHTELASPHIGQMFLHALQKLHQQQPPSGQSTDDALLSFAGHALDRHAKAIRKLVCDWKKLNETQRHTLRKQIKKMRYAVEFFSSLYNANKVGKFLASQQLMQKTLGILNDATVTRLILQDMATELPQVAFACGMATGWHACARQQNLEKADQALKDMKQAKPFW